jgi:hypothetical protein
MTAPQPVKKAPKARTASKTAPAGSAGKPLPPDQSHELAIPIETVRDEPRRDRTALEAEIKEQAYEIYLARGCAPGDDLLDWLEAERIVLYRRGASV